MNSIQSMASSVRNPNQLGISLIRDSNQSVPSPNQLRVSLIRNPKSIVNPNQSRVSSISRICCSDSSDGKEPVVTSVNEKENENENEGRSAWAVFETLLPSKEWAQSFSLLNYEDLCQYYEPLVLHEHIQPSTFVANVMTEIRYSARPEQLLEDINHYFDEVSGVPVVDNDFKCVGVLSKKDRSKAANAMKSRVSEVMSTPAITIFADKTVSDAAVLMLKNKIHRIPIVNNSNQVIGMVTRTDIFTALEGCVAE